MSWRLKQTKMGDYYILLEYRKIHPITKEKCYKSELCRFDNNEFKTQLKEYANSGTIPKKLSDFFISTNYEFEKKMNKIFQMGIDKTNTTVSEYVDIFIEFQKKNKAPTTWSRDVDVAPYIKDKLGNIKLTQLNQRIIQRFFDEVDEIKKHIVVVKPRDDFKEKLSVKGYDYSSIRKMIRQKDEKVKKNSINHYTLRKALDGKNVSKFFAENLSIIVGIPFEKLFIISERYEKISYNTKKKYTAFLSKMLSQAVKDGYIGENYSLSKYINRFKDNTPNKELKCMKFEEFHLYNKKMLEPYPNFPELIANMILAETGMRKEELCGLKWNAIDLEHHNVTIRTTVTYTNSLGIVVNELKTKNKSSFRTISVSNYLIEKLKEYKEYQLELIGCEKNIKIDTSDDNYWLFIQKRRENFGKVISPQTINTWVSNFLSYCNIPHYTVHAIRHTYVSYLLDTGKFSIAEVSRRVGHSSINVTLDIYAHVMQRLNGGAKSGQAYIEELLDKDESKPNLGSSSNIEMIKERLEVLKSLFESGLISETEYKDRKREILSDI